MVEVGHQIHLRVPKSERATQVVNETTTPSTIGVLEFSDVLSNTR